MSQVEQRCTRVLLQTETGSEAIELAKPTLHICDDGVIEWRVNGELHRDGAPARVGEGIESWWLNGELHREDGPALWHGVLDITIWCLRGKQHRDGGPALVWRGDEYWYRHGLKHRDGGPAVVRRNGGLEWWEHGVLV